MSHTDITSQLREATRRASVAEAALAASASIQDKLRTDLAARNALIGEMRTHLDTIGFHLRRNDHFGQSGPQCTRQIIDVIDRLLAKTPDSAGAEIARLRTCEDAWLAVSAALNDRFPDAWSATTDAKCGMAHAVAIANYVASDYDALRRNAARDAELIESLGNRAEKAEVRTAELETACEAQQSLRWQVEQAAVEHKTRAERLAAALERIRDGDDSGEWAEEIAGAALTGAPEATATNDSTTAIPFEGSLEPTEHFFQGPIPIEPGSAKVYLHIKNDGQIETPLALEEMEAICKQCKWPDTQPIIVLEIYRLRRKLEQVTAQADTKRLDWLADNHIEFAEELIRLGWNPANDAQWDKLKLFLRRIRAAIDAAMAANGGAAK